MEKRINVAELLKDCPSGMELDCTICEKVYFDEVTPHLIKCFVKIDDVLNTIYFHHDGAYMNITNAKCVIFPKGKTTWKGFQRPFNDGDVIFGCNSACSYIAIYKSNRNETSFNYYACLTSLGRFQMDAFADNLNLRPATKEEKKKLFDEIKTRSYKWNPENKTLEKLVKPKFKVGDRIVKRNSISHSWIVSNVTSEYYGLKSPSEYESIGVLSVSEQDDWELITNKLERSVEPKFKVGDVIQDADAYKVTITEVNVEDKLYGYESTIAKGIGGIAFSEQDNWKLVPNKFDINTLKPFESKVLVRDAHYHEWEGAIFGRYDGKKFFTIGGLNWGRCIPYEGNEHLHGTTNDCDDYYKTWK